MTAIEPLSDAAKALLSNPISRAHFRGLDAWRIVIDLDAVIHAYNEFIPRTFGVVDVQVGQTLWQTPTFRDDPVAQTRSRSRLAQALASPDAVVFHDIGVNPDGSTIDAEITITAIRDESEVPIGFLVEGRDVGELTRARAGLAEQQTLRQAFLDHGGPLSALLDPSGIVIEVNRRIERIGLTREQVVGRSLVDIGRTESEARAELWASRLREVRASDGPRHWTDVFGQDRSIRAADVTMAPIRADGELVWILLEMSDQTERHLATEALRANRAQLDAAAALANLGSFSFDRGTGHLEMDARASRILGVPLSIPPTERAAAILERVHPEDRHLLDSSETDNVPEVRRIEYRIVDEQAEAGVRDIVGIVRKEPSTHGGAPRFMGTVQDISRIRREEQARITLQKREAIATLVGAIAHDFNNLLGAMITFTRVARTELDRGEEPRESLAEIERAAERAAGVLGQIIGLGRDEQPTSEPVEVAGLLHEATALTRPYVGERIVVRSEVDEALPKVLVNSTELHQVLVNLVINAAQAIGDADGLIEISASSVDLQDDRAVGWGVEPGRYLSLRVADDGPGVPPDVQHRIFDPYFTTKPKGEGSGLGLASIQGIARRHGGAVRVQNAPAGGAVFTLVLPAATGSPERKAPAPPDEPAAIVRRRADAAGVVRVPGRGPLRVLYVDDEAALLRLAELTLPIHGIDVDGHQEARAALDVLRLDRGGYDAVVTDLAMPEIDGLAFIDGVRDLAGPMPVVLTSGYIDRATHEAAEARGVTELVRKPCTAIELAAAVRRAVSMARAAMPSD